MLKKRKKTPLANATGNIFLTGRQLLTDLPFKNSISDIHHRDRERHWLCYAAKNNPNENVSPSSVKHEARCHVGARGWGGGGRWIHIKLICEEPAARRADLKRSIISEQGGSQNSATQSKSRRDVRWINVSDRVSFPCLRWVFFPTRAQKWPMEFVEHLKPIPVMNSS